MTAKYLKEMDDRLLCNIEHNAYERGRKDGFQEALDDIELCESSQECKEMLMIHLAELREQSSE